EGEIALLLVSDFNNPGLFIDARAASFIVSKSISSPMGANLLALKDTKAIPDIVSGNDTQQYNWADICIKLQD
ncbi:MAG: hypothetical protein OEY51_12930, partial [Cyclobacteriaceae bacterium]|nr:hypothetical protein [Cyclobacteriaceae bacterium]